MKIDLDARDICFIRNALIHYESFCENCASAFKGTGHDEHYRKSIGISQKLRAKLTITTDKEDENER